MRLDVYPFRLHWQAEERVRFAHGLAGNSLRGALGLALRNTPLSSLFFAPAGAGPSGYRDRPRPFVLRAYHLDGRSMSPGELFHFDLHLFCRPERVVPQLQQAFAAIGSEGIGAGRGRARFTHCEALPVPALPLTPEPAPVRRLTVEFVTPTELKQEGRLAAEPAFPVLFDRARDRISALCTFYGQGGPLHAVDFAALAAQAEQVQCTAQELRQIETIRRSSRTGQRHGLGGFTGYAVYEGELGLLLPWLRAAQWSGVGRHTVWGQGVLALTWEA